MQASDLWTPEVWARVYGFPRGTGEGWASHRDGFHAGKFWMDPDPKNGFQSRNCQNPREQRVLEFLLSIFNLDKPKRIILTIANTLFRAMSGVWPVNWEILIHEFIEKFLPHIELKPSFLSLKSFTSTSITTASRQRRKTC